MKNIFFDRSICTNLAEARKKEWLVTNGIGGYACGTLPNLLTRRYHGYLIAALKPPLGRTLMAAKIDETIEIAGKNFPIFTNQWSDGTIEPGGYTKLLHFHLDGSIPVWTYSTGGCRLEKKIWMQQGANTTFVQYKVLEASENVTLQLKLITNFRDHHALNTTNEGILEVEPVTFGLRVYTKNKHAPISLLSQKGKWVPKNEWYRNYELSIERERGFDSVENHFYAGDCFFNLSRNEIATLVITTEKSAEMDGEKAFAERKEYDLSLLKSKKDFLPQLVLASEQFLVHRVSQNDLSGKTILAGYPWFSDWGRDTMISLPGLTIATGRADIAKSILKTYAGFVDQGMIPNRFPDESETPEYNTVDATLWFFEAVYAYFQATNDIEFLEKIFPIFKEIILHHEKGTRFNIHVDPEDWLLYAGEAGVQLTWMDAKVGDWVVTPRTGKQVEINALWYNALVNMAAFAEILNEPGAYYAEKANRVRYSFSRFWNEEKGHCFDVIDGPEGNEPDLRPNQLLTVSLTHALLSRSQQKQIIDICEQKLLTPYGLRSLSPDDPKYIGEYTGNIRKRDSAYHQGTVWAWLIGPFVIAHLKIYQDPKKARAFLDPLLDHLCEHGIGNVSEIFDGDPPHKPRGCIAQAWSVAEAIRAISEINKFESKARYK